MLTTFDLQDKVLTPEALYFEWLNSFSHELQNELHIYLKHHMGIQSLMELFSKKDQCIEDSLLHITTNFLIQRAKGIPLQYLLGEWDFLDFTLKVDKRVFIPRPETETLVQFASDAVTHIMDESPRAPSICDLGTGSGCIAIALARKFKNTKLYAVDISPLALECACENMELAGVAGRISLLQGDLFEPLKKKHETEKLELIVSNPPYIPKEEIRQLQKEVQHEPATALDGGADGLAFYRRIAGESKEFLSADGNVIVEAGYNQSHSIKAIFSQEGFFFKDSCLDDQKIERCLWFAKE